MKVEQMGGGALINLEPPEVELLTLALQRAGFEDTPPDRQQEIVEFAMKLRRALGDETSA